MPGIRILLGLPSHECPLVRRDGRTVAVSCSGTPCAEAARYAPRLGEAQHSCEAALENCLSAATFGRPHCDGSPDGSGASSILRIITYCCAWARLLSSDVQFARLFS